MVAKAKLNQYFPLISVLVILFAVMVWSLFPALSTIAVTQSMSRTNRLEEKTWKYDIQKYFLNRNIYIPLSDMFTMDEMLQLHGKHNDTKNTATVDSNKNSSWTAAFSKVCPKGKYFIWVPVPFKIPFYGKVIFEWCWSAA